MYSSNQCFLRLATLEACLPRAVRVDFGKCAIVRFLFAAAAAFLMFFLAARFRFAVAIPVLLRGSAPGPKQGLDLTPIFPNSQGRGC